MNGKNTDQGCTGIAALLLVAAFGPTGDPVPIEAERREGKALVIHAVDGVGSANPLGARPDVPGGSVAGSNTAGTRHVACEA